MDKNKNMIIGIVVILVAILFTYFAINNMKMANNEPIKDDSMTEKTVEKVPPKPIEQRIKEEFEDRKLVVDFNSVDDEYNQSGTATFEESPEGMIVTIEVTNPDPQLDAVNVHDGMCPEINEIAHELNPLVNGKSETIIETTLEQLTMQYPMSVGITMSGEAEGVTKTISCGYITIK